MTQGKPKRRIRNFLLDKRFQLKYTLAVVAVSAVISAGLGYFLYKAHRESSRVASLDDPDLDGALRAALLDEDRKVLFAMAGFLGGLVLCLGAVGIIATHKIAGPAYAMRRTMSMIADGKLPTVRALRKHDELQAVGDELKRMADNLREREESDLKMLKAALQSGGAPDQLKELIRQKEERLAS
jgi:HAMP domain-containing protein